MLADPEGLASPPCNQPLAFASGRLQREEEREEQQEHAGNIGIVTAA